MIAAIAQAISVTSRERQSRVSTRRAKYQARSKRPCRLPGSAPEQADMVTDRRRRELETAELSSAMVGHSRGNARCK